MLLSVVVRTKDEADRLRLTLTSFACQTMPPVGPEAQAGAEVIVVNDGSSDHTPAVLEEAGRSMPLQVVHHPKSLGRSAASNAGARLARGEVLLFIDGDVLAAPGLFERHASCHATDNAIQGRGETWHLRCTRFFQDPETGKPFPGKEEQVARLDADLAGHLVTRQQIREQFPDIDRRGQPGIYPGAGPRKLFELEMHALLNQPDLDVLWMAAAGSNQSVRRQDFVRAGGFDERITINEHRELAYSLCLGGARMVAVPGARSYHMTHRSGWRDPLTEVTDWERIFFEKHPCRAVRLMSLFWLSLAGDPHIPPDARISSLENFQEILAGDSPFDYDAIRDRHPQLQALSK